MEQTLARDVNEMVVILDTIDRNQSRRLPEAKQSIYYEVRLHGIATWNNEEGKDSSFVMQSVKDDSSIADLLKIILKSINSETSPVARRDIVLFPKIDDQSKEWRPDMTVHPTWKLHLIFATFYSGNARGTMDMDYYRKQDGEIMINLFNVPETDFMSVMPYVSHVFNKDSPIEKVKESLRSSLSIGCDFSLFVLDDEGGIWRVQDTDLTKTFP